MVLKLLLFQSTPPVWGETPGCWWFVPRWRFQSTPPVWGETAHFAQRVRDAVISIHSPRVGGDRCTCADRTSHSISIHSPRVGGDREALAWKGTPEISIHSPPCGGRHGLTTNNFFTDLFQSTPPRVGGDPSCFVLICHSRKFQSTPPVRGETRLCTRAQPRGYISIHSPRAGGDHTGTGNTTCSQISIHSPRAGGDAARSVEEQRVLFQSTPPVRGGDTGVVESNLSRWDISIHSPRAGGDAIPPQQGMVSVISIHSPRAGGDGNTSGHFFGSLISIHSPRAGGDVVARGSSTIILPFQSTPPVRGETVRMIPINYRGLISIHSPRAGGDGCGYIPPCSHKHFNPLPPCGGRHKVTRGLK